MNARETILNQLSAYLDGELNDVEVRVVEAALAKDPSLVTELDGLRATRDLLRSLPTRTLGGAFAQRVAQKAATRRGGFESPESEYAPGVSRWIRYAAAAAIVAVSAGVGMMVSQSIHTTPAKPTIATRSEPSSLTLPSNGERLGRKSGNGVSAKKTSPDLVRFDEDEMNKDAGWARGDTSNETLELSKRVAKLSTLDKDISPPTTKGGAICGETIRMRGGPPKIAKGKYEDYSYASNVKLAKSLALEKLAALTAQPDTGNEVIFLEDLATGEKTVEKVLFSNGVQLASTNQRAVYYNQGMNLNRNVHFAKEVQSQRGSQTSSDGKFLEVQYVVYDSPEKLRAIRDQLRALLKKKAQLRVSQLPEPMYQQALQDSPLANDNRLAIKEAEGGASKGKSDGIATKKGYKRSGVASKPVGASVPSRPRTIVPAKPSATGPRVPGMPVPSVPTAKATSRGRGPVVSKGEKLETRKDNNVADPKVSPEDTLDQVVANRPTPTRSLELPQTERGAVAKKTTQTHGLQSKRNAKDAAPLGEIVATEESDGKKVAATRSKIPEADLDEKIEAKKQRLEDRDVAPADKKPVAQKHKEDNPPQSKATAGDVLRREKIVADEKPQDQLVATTPGKTEDRSYETKKPDTQHRLQKNRDVAPAEKKQVAQPNSPVVVESDVRQGGQAKPTVVAGDLKQARERQVRSNTQLGFRQSPQAIVITLRYRRPTSRLNATQKTALRRMERVQDLHLKVLQRQQIEPPTVNASQASERPILRGD